MLEHLIESNVAFSPRVGSSAVSTMVHAGLISAAIAMTATTHHAITQPDVTRLTYVAPRVNVITQQTVQSSSARANPNRVMSSGASTTTPLIVAPQITVGIPDVDLSRPVSQNTEFSASRYAGNGTSTFGAGVPTDGNAVLNSEQVEKAVVMAQGSAVPSFPAALRAAGVSGGVMMDFVVDTLGRIELESVRKVQSDHDLFTQSVRAVLAKLRFIPAEAHGRKVRQLVRLPFRFDLH